MRHFVRLGGLGGDYSEGKGDGGGREVGVEVDMFFCLVNDGSCKQLVLAALKLEL